MVKPERSGPISWPGYHLAVLVNSLQQQQQHLNSSSFSVRIR